MGHNVYCTDKSTQKHNTGLLNHNHLKESFSRVFAHVTHVHSDVSATCKETRNEPMWLNVQTQPGHLCGTNTVTLLASCLSLMKLCFMRMWLDGQRTICSNACTVAACVQLLSTIYNSWTPKHTLPVERRLRQAHSCSVLFSVTGAAGACRSQVLTNIRP